jgi:glycosyltransferase involved in cell wall biosynthesis
MGDTINGLYLSDSMIKLGIECENLEDAKSRWGVGRLVLNLLKEYEKNPIWQKEFKLYLYFNQFIPDDVVLRNPIFIKRVVGWRSLRSFNLFYHILMPLRAMRDGLNFMFFPAYMLPPLYFGKAVTLLTNDVYYEYTKGSLPFKYKLAYRLFSNWAARFSHKILAISEASKKEVAKLYNIPSTKIFVSKLGVELYEDSTDNHEKSDKPRINRVYMLYVGQMFPRRHAKETILAFEQIATEYKDVNLILVGRDKYSPSIINQLVNETNNRLSGVRIIHHDYIQNYDEIINLYKHALLVIYVSDSEAFGLPPVEAASLGTPVVVMDNDLNHELFSSSAFFSRSGNVADIANALRSGLSNDDRRGHFAEEYKRIMPQLSWYNFAKNFFDNVKKQ